MHYPNIGTDIGMAATEEFRRLINPEEEGGQRRREILAYIARNLGCTKYGIAKGVYGDPEKYYDTVQYHLRKLREVSEKLGSTEHGQLLVEERQADGSYAIRLTEGGRNLCLTEGIVMPSSRAEEFIAGFNRRLDGKLTPAQWEKLRKLLSDPMMDALEKIAKKWAETGGVAREIGLKAYPELASKIPEVQSVLEDKVLKVLYPIWWYDAETGVSTTTPEMAGLGADVASREMRRKLKRALPKLLPRFKLATEKSFVTSRVAKERKLTNRFENLVNFVDEVIANDPHLLKVKGSCQTEYLTLLLLPMREKFRQIIFQRIGA